MKAYIVQYIEGGNAHEPRAYATEDAAMADFMKEATQWGFTPERNTIDHSFWRDQFSEFVSDLDSGNDLRYYEVELQSAPNIFLEAVVEGKALDGDGDIMTVRVDNAEFLGLYVKMQKGKDFFPVMHVMDFDKSMRSRAQEVADRINFLLKRF